MILVLKNTVCFVFWFFGGFSGNRKIKSGRLNSVISVSPLTGLRRSHASPRCGCSWVRDREVDGQERATYKTSYVAFTLNGGLPATETRNTATGITHTWAGIVKHSSNVYIFHHTVTHSTTLPERRNVVLPAINKLTLRYHRSAGANTSCTSCLSSDLRSAFRLLVIRSPCRTQGGHFFCTK